MERIQNKDEMMSDGDQSVKQLMQSKLREKDNVISQLRAQIGESQRIQSFFGIVRRESRLRET